jgi:hypothetical protein
MRSRMAGRVASLLGPLLVLAVGCSSSPSKPCRPPHPAGRSHISGTADVACATTAPGPARSVPAALRAWDATKRWYGSGDLWVAEPDLPAVVDSAGGALRIKYASATLDARGEVTDHKGAPRVAAERTDGPGSVQGDTGGFATADGGMRWWPTTLAFPRAGCWAVTETLGSTTLRFTLSVTAH